MGVSSSVVDGQALVRLSAALRPDHAQGVVLFVEAGVYLLEARLHPLLKPLLGHLDRNIEALLQRRCEPLDGALLAAVRPANPSLTFFAVIHGDEA